MIKVENIVNVYEVDGKEKSPHGADGQKLIVRSHWNRNEMVVLRLPGEGAPEFTVTARDLQAAIVNATNTNRHG